MNLHDWPLLVSNLKEDSMKLVLTVIAFAVVSTSSLAQQTYSAGELRWAENVATCLKREQANACFVTTRKEARVELGEQKAADNRPDDTRLTIHCRAAASPELVAKRDKCNVEGQGRTAQPFKATQK